MEALATSVVLAALAGAAYYVAWRYIVHVWAPRRRPRRIPESYEVVCHRVEDLGRHALTREGRQ